MQREQAERDLLRLVGERERTARDYRTEKLSPEGYEELRAQIEEEQRATDAQVERLRAREGELSSENLLAEIDAETTETLTELRLKIVEHVRGARDLDSVRGALLTVFDGFTLHPDDRLEPRPRIAALVGFVDHREHHWDPSELEPVFKRVPVSTRETTYSNSSPSQ